MKSIKRFIYAALIAAVTVLLTACGGQLTTELTVKDDMSGSRVMTWYVDLTNSDIRYKGEPADILKTVEKNCPKELSLESQLTETDATLKFTLKFDSIEDYEKKAKALLVLSDESYENAQGLITYMKPESVFAKGVSYNEKLYSTDLMRWFSDLLVNSGYVDSSDRSYIFDSTSQTFNIMGTSGEGSQAYVDNISYLALNGISYYTSLNGDGTYDRTIVVSMPQVTLDSANDAVKAFLEVNQKDGITGEWSNENGVVKYTIKGKALNDTALNAMMNTFYGRSGESLFRKGEVKPSNDENKKNTVELAGGVTYELPEGFFYEISRFSEKFDLENYVSNAYGSVNFEYFVNTPGTYRGSYSNEDYSGRKISVKVDDEKDPGTLYYSSNYKSEIDVLSINEMVPSRVAMTISLGTGYNIVRSLEFDFDGAVSDDKASQIKERFIAAIGETKGLEVDKCKNDKETFTVILESDADASVEPGLWKEAFGCSNSLVLTRNSNAILAGRRITSIDDRFNIGAFVNSKIKTLDVKVEGIGKTEKYGVEEENRKGSNYFYTKEDYSSSTVKTSVTGEKSNPLPVILWIIFALALAVALYAALPAIIKLIKDKLPQKTVKTEAPAASVFCTSCGAKLEPGTAFCIKCGAPVKARTAVTEPASAPAAAAAEAPAAGEAELNAREDELTALDSTLDELNNSGNDNGN